MKPKKIAKKVAKQLPIAGSYLKRKEREFRELEAQIQALQARNDEWAAEVRQLRRDDEPFYVLWPVFKEDLIAADYRRPAKKSTYKGRRPPYTFNWVMGPVGSVSGGHSVIFQLISALESRGHTCRIYFYDPLGESSLEASKANMKNHSSVKAQVFYNETDMAACDGLFATSWPSAYPVYNYQGAAKKFYLLQDYEPMFEPSGTYSALAENTYRMGLHGISTTPFTGQRCRKEFGMKVDDIELGIDPSKHYLSNKGPRKKLVFYARPVTPRRGFELGTLALEVFHKQHPEYEINCIGWDISRYKLPFPYVGHGILSTKQLNELYNQCAASLVLSFTSMSLTAVEMMAAGCQPVVNNGPDSSLVSYHKHLYKAEPNPVALAERLYEAIEFQNQHKSHSQTLADFAKKFSWDSYNDKFEKILLKELG